MDDNEMSKREEELAIARDAEKERTMKASELIVKLQNAIAEYGDQNVMVCNVEAEVPSETLIPCVNIVPSIGKDNKVDSFLLADYETALAFS